jgi:hypothetical protein
MYLEAQNYVPTASSVAELRDRIGKICYSLSGFDEVLIIIQRCRAESGKLNGYNVEARIPEQSRAHMEKALEYVFGAPKK